MAMPGQDTPAGRGGRERDNAIVACDTMFMKPNTAGNFSVVVLIDGEEHKFTFSRSVIEKLQTGDQ
jgi:hypothetical protein